MATNRHPARFLEAETVMPTVSYRSPPQPPQAQPVARAVPRPMPPQAPARPAPQAAPAIRVLPSVEIDQEQSVMEHMPMPPRVAPVQSQPQTPGQFLSQRRGELTVMFNCRGGSGATTLAVNTAAMIARAGRSVCVVDFDLELGDVCVALDLDAQTSLAAVAREAHLLDAVSLRRRLAQHGSGVCALSQVGHPDDVDPQLAARMPALLSTLRANFDHVVIDGVRDFGEMSLAAIDVATRIVIVVTQDVPSVRRAARVLELLGRLGVEPARCALVVNRAVRKAAVDEAAIERALALPIAVTIREDGRVGEALDAGALLVDVARSRPVVEDVARLASLCRPSDSTASTRRAPRRWFQLFGGGS